MTEYRITWEIDIEAETPEQAAKMAREIQLDPESTATIFVVTSKAEGVRNPQSFTLDLQDLEEVGEIYDRNE